MIKNRPDRGPFRYLSAFIALTFLGQTIVLPSSFAATLPDGEASRGLIPATLNQEEEDQARQRLIQLQILQDMQGPQGAGPSSRQAYNGDLPSGRHPDTVDSLRYNVVDKYRPDGSLETKQLSMKTDGRGAENWEYDGASQRVVVKIYSGQAGQEVMRYFKSLSSAGDVVDVNAYDEGGKKIQFETFSQDQTLMSQLFFADATRSINSGGTETQRQIFLRNEFSKDSTGSNGLVKKVHYNSKFSHNPQPIQVKEYYAGSTNLKRDILWHSELDRKIKDIEYHSNGQVSAAILYNTGEHLSKHYNGQINSIRVLNSAGSVIYEKKITYYHPQNFPAAQNQEYNNTPVYVSERWAKNVNNFQEGYQTKIFVSCRSVRKMYQVGLLFIGISPTIWTYFQMEMW